jgi:hypothetical protein
LITWSNFGRDAQRRRIVWKRQNLLPHEFARCFILPVQVRAGCA